MNRNIFFSDLIEILKKYNYDISDKSIKEQISNVGWPEEEGFFGTMVFFNKDCQYKYILVEMKMDTKYLEKYERALEKNRFVFEAGEAIPGFENLDYSKCKITELFFSGPISIGTSHIDNTMSFDENNPYDENGISLSYRVPYGMGRENYYKITIENIEKSLQIQSNISEYTKWILTEHCKNIDIITNICLPILKKYDFKEYSNSLFIKNEDFACFYISYSHQNLRFNIYIETDLFNGKLKISGYGFDYTFNKISKKIFERVLRENVIDYYKKEFEYIDSNDENENINSYFEVIKCLEIINDKWRPSYYHNYENTVFIENVPLKYLDIGQKAKYKLEFNDIKNLKWFKNSTIRGVRM